MNYTCLHMCNSLSKVAMYCSKGKMVKKLRGNPSFMIPPKIFLLTCLAMSHPRLPMLPSSLTGSCPNTQASGTGHTNTTTFSEYPIVIEGVRMCLCTKSARCIDLH